MRLAISLLFLASSVSAQWPQWGATAQHDSHSPVPGRLLDFIAAEIVLDPFAEMAEATASGELLAHYPVPLIDGNDLFLVKKTGAYSGPQTRESQTWNVVNMRWSGGQLATRWTYASDWKPVPFGNGNAVVTWEPVYHPAVTADAVWAPAAGGAIDKLSRDTGLLIRRFNPYGLTDPTIFVSGPPVVDASGNVYYNTIKLDTSSPWANDPPNSWLVRIGADGTMAKATFLSLTPNAPAASAQCATAFSGAQLPWPPSPDAATPATRCGPQRPGINVAPAVAPDGTVYTISRAHGGDRDAFLIAANSNLTLKWSSSLRNRLHDGCDIALPASGTPGGCRAGSVAGVDPAVNAFGSGRVLDTATSSPVVTPDGRILYGSYTRYNYAQGHLMMFGPDGAFIGAYGWGWDLTPAIYRHDGTYSILLKENHYNTSSYCGDPFICPFDRNATTPWDPEWYFITQLDPSLNPEWKFRSTNTQSCERKPDGTLDCAETNANGFEWCVNAIAVDSRGIVYANSEDGNLYAIGQGGTLAGHIFLRLALGAAYTPTSIGPDGRIYTQNDGNLFVIDERPRRRAVKR